MKNSRMHRLSCTPRKIIIIVVIAVIFVICLGGNIVMSFNDHHYVATVTKQERINAGEESYYLIFAQDDKGNYYEFKNEDNLFRLKFDSSRLYNEITVGETYDFTVVGYRITAFSCYENIIKVEKVS